MSKDVATSVNPINKDITVQLSSCNIYSLSVIL